MIGEHPKIRGGLMKHKWVDRYGWKRIILWDNTNITIPAPSDADTNRETYSAYYDENCAKGGVLAQFCGWIGTLELWAGAISDTDYLTTAGILKLQDEFSKKDNSLRNLPFLNIMDKGYRILLAAWRAGKQLLLQPFYAKSDRKFNTNEVLVSSTVASDRSGNERAVNVAKRARMLRDSL